MTADDPTMLSRQGQRLLQIGVGNETIVLMGELPHGLHHGSVFQETFIKVLAYSSAPTGLIALALVLWGLRLGGREEPSGGAQG